MPVSGGSGGPSSSARTIIGNQPALAPAYVPQTRQVAPNQAAVATATTLDPATKSSLVTLSNGNLTATGTTGVGEPQGTRSTVAKTSGDWYFEVRYDTKDGSSQGVSVGLVNSSQSLTSFQRPGQTTGNGISLHPSGIVYFNSSSTGPITPKADTAGDVIMVAFKTSTGKVWFGEGGTWDGDPAAGTGGYSSGLAEFYAFVGPLNADVTTARFDSASQTYAAPTGFTAWDSSTANSYTLTAGSGSFALTGSAATLKAARLLTASAGSFTVTGSPATLKKGYLLTASSGSFVLTGSVATLTAARKLTASAGSFVINGAAATLKRGLLLTAGSGSYALTGSSATLLKALKLVAGSGAYTVTGSSATLTKSSASSYTLTANGGSFALSGSAVALLVGHKLIALAGGYEIAGSDADLIRTQIDYPAVPSVGWHAETITGSWSGTDSGGGGAWVPQDKCGSWSGSDYSGGGAWIKKPTPNRTW
jgi:hypothetical protein